MELHSWSSGQAVHYRYADVGMVLTPTQHCAKARVLDHGRLETMGRILILAPAYVVADHAA